MCSVQPTECSAGPLAVLLPTSALTRCEQEGEAEAVHPQGPLVQQIEGGIEAARRWERAPLNTGEAARTRSAGGADSHPPPPWAGHTCAEEDAPEVSNDEYGE